MNKNELNIHESEPSFRLFTRVVSILGQARSNVARCVNHEIVLAYWLIGKEIIQELQGGDERASYGTQLINELSVLLSKEYGKGFSPANIWLFRQFYQAFADRTPILDTPCRESSAQKKLDTSCRESLAALPAIGKTKTFQPNLGWSHYRILMKIDNLARQ